MSPQRATEDGRSPHKHVRAPQIRALSRTAQMAPREMTNNLAVHGTARSPFPTEYFGAIEFPDNHENVAANR